MRDQYWVIFDRLDGNGCHRVDQRYHLSPGATVEWDHDRGRLLIHKDQTGLVFVPIVLVGAGDKESSQRTEIQNGFAEIECGQDERIAIIETTRTGPLPFSLASFLAPLSSRTHQPSLRVLNMGESSGLQAVEIDGFAFTDKIVLRHGERVIRGFLDDWKSDASVLILRYDSNDVLQCAFVADATTLIHNSLEHIHGNAPSQLRKILFRDTPSCS